METSASRETSAEVEIASWKTSSSMPNILDAGDFRWMELDGEYSITLLEELSTERLDFSSTLSNK
jgi:hypothetical protein